MRRQTLLICSFAVALAACGKDQTNNTPNPNNGAVADMGGEDLTAADDGRTNNTQNVDQGPESDCLQVIANLETFRVSQADDVSIEYSATVSPEIFGQERELSLLFERYNNSEYIGTFELGTNEDNNFGTCTHCLFIRGDNPERAWFADAGTFTSQTNPYSRSFDVELNGLRLIEVGVDPFTRESAPLADGRCIEVADFAHAGMYPVPGWTCPTEQYADNTECNCECGAVDPDCGGAISCLPGDPGCTPRPELPTANCAATEVCAFEPVSMSSECTETCDWGARSACVGANTTCVFDFGVGAGDLCLPADGPRIEPTIGIGEACPQNIYQLLCNVVDGFAEGYCGPNNVCRSLCESDAECTEVGHTCRVFTFDNPLGYCGPEPTDG